MSQAKAGKPILLVAHDRGLRRQLEHALGEDVRVIARSPDALGKTELLAKGIYEAMTTTAAGLLVAIPVLVCFHFISAKIDRLVMDIDQMSMTFVDEVVEGSFGAEQAETVAAGPGDGEAADDMPASSVQVATN